MTHIEQLEARYDGRIPEAERRAAAAADRSGPLLRAARTAIRIKSYNGPAIVERMAAVMVEAAGEREACTEDDLRRAGYTDEAIGLFAEPARIRAAIIAASAERRA